MSVEVTIDQGRIARFLRLRGGLAEKRLRARTERVAAIARREAPGTMPAYIETRVDETPRGLQGVVSCDHPATLFVLNGTRPHVIRPRRAKALRFEVSGHVVFAARVNHPGTRANNFLGRALREGA
ncbi:hypothetical protein [Streptomyces sp. NRRL S-350]|uniref:hypothetical protein n=1 Tax=Streptomyces sp. NRRL S-350 TaxID=1463902 RepID=UPI0005624884|nr:hypothetical protein [Streptomyces sp. NRRL S-350]